MSIADDLKELTKSATRKWTKQRKAEERGKHRSSRVYVYSDRVDFTDVAHQILPAAYLHASGNGRYTVNKRNLFYASRQKFLNLTGRAIQYPYFANTLLVKYLNQHPEASTWKITADPRGTLIIPNASHVVSIPCGTIQIENHLVAAGKPIDPWKLGPGMPIEWSSLAAGQRYQGVLYIEKEGFGPMLKEAQIAEHYDLAVISCKGQSVTAARRYVDEVCRVLGGVPLFAVHDFDKYGFEIAHCLTEVSDAALANDRVTYRFKNRINVTDLGLRLEDAKKYGLDPEDCEFKGSFPRNSPCTDEEKRFLRSGRRIELNAFTAPDFIAWLEDKLDEHLPERLIPEDEVLEKAYRRALAVAEINRAMRQAKAKAIKNAKKAVIPDSLREELEKAMRESESDDAWDVALYQLAESKLFPNAKG